VVVLGGPRTPPGALGRLGERDDADPVLPAISRRYTGLAPDAVDPPVLLAEQFAASVATIHRLTLANVARHCLSVVNGPLSVAGTLKDAERAWLFYNGPPTTDQSIMKPVLANVDHGMAFVEEASRGDLSEEKIVIA